MSQEEPGEGARGSQEEPGGTQEEPGGARRSQEEPDLGEARRNQDERSSAFQPYDLHGPWTVDPIQGILASR